MVPVAAASAWEPCIHHQRQDAQYSQITTGSCEAQAHVVQGRMGSWRKLSPEAPRTVYQTARVKEPHGEIWLGIKEWEAGPQP